MAMRMLEGDVSDPRDERISELEQEVRDLTDELSHTKFALGEAQRQGTRGMSNLRRQLSPLYKALQDVFGELEKAGVSDEKQDRGGDSRTQMIWDSWKRKMGAASPVIDALLLQPGMNQTQIGIAIGRSRKTVPALIFKLKQAGLITKDGDRYSLKQL